MKILDAHNHLQFPVFHNQESEIISTCTQLGITSMIVNATKESDWDAVSQLAKQFSGFVIPAFGLHPWWISERSSQWETKLEALLQNNPHATVGECGIDYWIENHDPAEQERIFVRHLEIATNHARPVMIHCIRAWEPLLALLKKHPPVKPFLLHAYGGPAEMINAFAKLGAYFSFAPNLCDPKRSKNHLAARRVPPDRLLLESDAPDMLPPDNFIRIPLFDHNQTIQNHPANLLSTAVWLAELRSESQSQMLKQIAINAAAFLNY